MSFFSVCMSAHDVDEDSWETLKCPLTEGIHKLEGHGDQIFDDPQWVVVKKKTEGWEAALADSEGQAFDILLNRGEWGQEFAPLKPSSDGPWLDKF